MLNLNKKSIVFALSLIASVNAYAAGGDRGAGNGGDICEDHFKVVRDDIASWIGKGGSAGLTLPEGVSLTQYNKGMLDEIAKAQVSCTDDVVKIGEAEKTCRNFVDPSGISRILCNIRRFMKETSDSDQYVLVHHEYAGLAGFEVNDGENSHYVVSNQISAYLQDEVVKKLAVKPVQSVPSGSRQFVVTLQGSSINPQVCGLVFIQACDQAEAQCRALGDPTVECDNGCEQNYISGVTSVGDENSCSVTATLNAPIVPWKDVDTSARLATTSFPSVKECQNALAILQGVNSNTTEFSMQSDCNGSLLELRITPSQSRERAPSDGALSEGLYATSGDYGSQSSCLEARNLLFNLASSDFSINAGLDEATENCDYNFGGFFDRQYRFAFQVHVNRIFKD